MEHILPGGIGTYSISHISNYFYQRIPKPEDSTVFTVPQASSTDKNEEHSNCSSYTGSGFTLQEESASKKGKLEKENDGERSDYARGNVFFFLKKKSYSFYLFFFFFEKVLSAY